jgi:hypothetical protein
MATTTPLIIGLCSLRGLIVHFTDLFDNNSLKIITIQNKINTISSSSDPLIVK